ncbi:hypothetical protein [Actinoplanes derwentensis]|uniref:Uncharacterized protein n=1 Tax=Actinoplanes derwentensis TaxID=113562 RepID=A0A1H2DEH0_9ACTN|nr:hypothetical protein [Actinoplanes derwentensis]GID84764.1 hypothetical protein Ade03nite_36880 [Actinoplanes derwentensis]SDT81145.1 hypothetical protein SAMN04489716_9514 [Actinoplanes derwentensis]
MVISPSPVVRLRELAATGRLAVTAAGPERGGLVAAAYELVWPIVFARVTCRFERQRGHSVCATGVGNLADECLDRFHDDVEAVVDDLLGHARQPIRQLEAWITPRLNAATVNAHRRRRGARGALQRPRLPGWLVTGLDRDPWLTALATDILTWAGTSGTAGGRLWPVESWSQKRGLATGDWTGSDPVTVGREIEEVLSVMRTHPKWFESYVERPLGAKQPPVVAMATDSYGEPLFPLAPGDAADRIESELRDLAGAAVRVIADRIGRGEAAGPVVVEVIRTIFGGAGAGTLEQVPHSVADPIAGILGDLTEPDRVARIVAAVLETAG